MATEITLSYKIKLFPSRVKADTLAALVDLFQREHSVATQLLASGDRPRLPSCQGKGEFVGRAYRRAGIDFFRCRKATAVVRREADRDLTWALKKLPSSHSGKYQRRLLGVIDKTSHTLTQMRNRETVHGHPFKLPFLKAQLIDSAEIQSPRTAKSFDCWIMLRGTTASRGKNGGFYIPARKHVAINRTLALPGAVLNESAEVFRKNGKFYARVTVTVPAPEVKEPKGYLGCDVGLRASVTRSDGYRGPDLRPIIKKQQRRRASQQRAGFDRSYTTSPQRQALSREARKAVSVALRSGRGVSLEDPQRLPKWKQWAAREFAKRVELLAALAGVPVWLLPPAYTSRTCYRCKARDTFRQKTMLRCLHCGYTQNADFNGALNIASGACRVTAISHGSLRLVPAPGGAEAVE